MNTKNSAIASHNWTLNATAPAREKFDGGVTGQSTTSTPWKFNSVSQRNSTVPGFTAEFTRILAVNFKLSIVTQQL